MLGVLQAGVLELVGFRDAGAVKCRLKSPGGGWRSVLMGCLSRGERSAELELVEAVAGSRVCLMARAVGGGSGVEEVVVVRTDVGVVNRCSSFLHPGDRRGSPK